MIRELSISDIGSYVNEIYRIVNEQEYRMWYRGQSNYSWGLLPSVQRETKEPHREQYITTNFMIQTMRLSHNAPQQYDRARWLTMMQHYGLPTRLLDWSESPLVALYFALKQSSQTDAAVWVLNPMKLNQKMDYGEYVPPINYRSVEKYLEGAFSEPQEAQDQVGNNNINGIIACHGVGNDLRMYVQQSNFTVHSSDLRLDKLLEEDDNCDYLYKIRISSQIKKVLFKQLDIMGFHDSTIYPDMEHIAEEQKKMHFMF